MTNLNLSAKERKRLKYSAIREQKKQKALMVIDDSPLRKTEIRAAKAWLKKIDKLDEAIERFHVTDQRLFQEWHELTFRDLTEQISKKREEYFSYADFHNQMVLLSNQKKISIPKAYRILIEEEMAFKNGDAAARSKIDELRAKRKIEMEEEMQKERQKENEECDCPDCRRARREPQEFSESQANESEGRGKDDFQLDSEIKSRVDYFAALDDATIKKFLSKSQLSALIFLVDAIQMCMMRGREDVARRIWNLTPVGVKREFNKFNKKNFGISFDDFLNGIDQDSDDFEDEDFEAELKSSNHDRHRGQALSEDDRLKIKIVYRKIVRLIHPDQLDHRLATARKPWLENIWKKSVRANEREDLRALTKVYHQILVALEEFNSLSVTELRSVVSSVQNEHSEKVAEANNMKSNPAWNFSKLKDYTRLKTKMAKPFHQELANLDADINELRAKRVFLEKLIKSGADLNRRRPPQKKRRANRRRNGPRTAADRQMSFGF